MNSKERKTLEDAGLLYLKSEPKKTIIIKYSGVSLSQEWRDRIRAEIEQAGDIKAILLPPGFELAENLGQWKEKEDPDYSGGGYTACSVCGQRYAWGAYHEPQEFRHCPRCGHRMEVEEDEI